MFNNFIFENRALYETKWKNIVDRGKPQTTISNMRIACWIPKVTHTHTHTQVVYCSLLFHCNNGCTNAPQRYRYIVRLVSFTYIKSLNALKRKKLWTHCWRIHISIPIKAICISTLNVLKIHWRCPWEVETCSYIDIIKRSCVSWSFVYFLCVITVGQQNFRYWSCNSLQISRINIVINEGVLTVLRNLLLLLLSSSSSSSSSSSLVTGLFFLVLLLNQRWSPPLRLQASHCSTFLIMCDVPSIAVFIAYYYSVLCVMFQV